MQAGKSQRSVLALVIACALILGFGIPLIPLVGVDSAEGTEVSAASDVATVSAENSLQNGSFEQPDVYQYRETSDVPAARHHTRREIPMVPEAQGASVRFEERFRYTRGHHRGHAWRRTAIVLMG